MAKKGSIKLPSGAATPDVFVQVPQRSRYNAAHLVVEPGQYLNPFLFSFYFFGRQSFCMTSSVFTLRLCIVSLIETDI